MRAAAQRAVMREATMSADDDRTGSTSGYGRPASSRRARSPPMRSTAARCLSTARESSPPARSKSATSCASARRAAEFVVLVQQLSARRGSAANAATLFTETEDSRRRRDEAKLSRADSHPDAYTKGRPYQTRTPHDSQVARRAFVGELWRLSPDAWLLQRANPVKCSVRQWLRASRTLGQAHLSFKEAASWTTDAKWLC